MSKEIVIEQREFIFPFQGYDVPIKVAFYYSAEEPQEDFYPGCDEEIEVDEIYIDLLNDSFNFYSLIEECLKTYENYEDNLPLKELEYFLTNFNEEAEKYFREKLKEEKKGSILTIRDVLIRRTSNHVE